MRGALICLASLLLAGCSSPTEPVETLPDVPPFELTTPGWIGGRSIPATYTCDGDGEIPSLFWNSAPEETTHYALLVTNLDTDQTLWSWWNLPGHQGATFGERTELPRGRTHGGGLDYVPPCPPVGELHRYEFRMVALAEPLTLAEGAAGPDVKAAMDANAIGLALLRGTYERGE